jgi:transcriptional regulator with XRE-family HTH domain
VKDKTSLRQIARQLGVSASYLSQVRNGKRPASVKLLSNSSFEMLSAVKHDATTETLTTASGRIRTDDRRFTKPLLYP